MACVNTMQGLYASTHKISIGRQEGMQRQGKELSMGVKQLESALLFPPLNSQQKGSSVGLWSAASGLAGRAMP